MALNDFLIKHQINKKGEQKISTHTRIPDKELNIHGGNYHIEDNELDEFYQLYFDYIKSGGKEYLTEKQKGLCIAIDLDFRYDYKVVERQHTKSQVSDIVCVYLDEIGKYFIFNNDTEFNCYVFEKPHVNRLADGSLTKDGIHIIFDIKMAHNYQEDLRKTMIKVLPDYIHLPLINTWESVIDEGIAKGNTNWNIYGSGKPHNEVYEIKYHFKIGFDESDKQFTMLESELNEIKNNPKLLSVQYPYNKEFPYSDYANSITIKGNKSEQNNFEGQKGVEGNEIKNIVFEILKINNKFFDDYEKWSQLGYIIFNETSGSNDGELLYIELSLKFGTDSGKKHDDNQVKKQYYNTQTNRTKKLTINSLYSWLKDVNPNSELLKNRINNRFASTDDEASDILFEELKNVFKSYKQRLFYLDNNIWIYDELKIDDIILNYILKSKIYLGINEKTNKLIPYTQNISKAKKVQEALYSKIRVLNNDHELYNKFHYTMKQKLCFVDGVLDFSNKTFTLWNEIKPNTIYSIVKINRKYHEYFKNPDKKVIQDIKTKIFEVLYGNKTNTALQFLSRAIAGHHEDKRWATYLGNRNCGKGVEFDLLKYSFEDYVSTFELGNMLYCRKTSGMENVDCSKKLYWLLDLEFVRLAISQEIPDCNSGLQANSKILKKITGGGDEIVARRNYDRKDTYFYIDTTFYIKGNNSLICDNPDCDETRIEFNSVVQFKTQNEIDFMKQEGRDEKELERYKIADPNIKTLCKTLEWKNAIVYLLMENYTDKCVEIEKHIDIEDNSLIANLKEKYDFTYNNEDVILCSELHANMSVFDKGKIALELNSINIFKKRATQGVNKGKFLYFGIKMKNIE